jgi:outer membrane lipoprotein LolB
VQHWRAAALSALLVVLLAACSGLSREPGEVPGEAAGWPELEAQLQRLDDWRASGKISLRNAQRSESVNMTWTQQSNNTRMQLSGPLGFSATTISSDGSYLEINQGTDTRHFDISSPEAIVRETGWNLPLKALHYWLKGLPAPQHDIEEADTSKGYLSLLKQAGWVISYQGFGHFGQYQLPTKIQLEGADTRIRVIIRDWQAEAV